MTYARVLRPGLTVAGMALGFAMSAWPRFCAVAHHCPGIINGHGWRAAYLGLGLLVLVVGWPIQFFVMRDSPGPSGCAGRGAGLCQTPDRIRRCVARAGGNDRRDAVRTREFWMLMAIFFIVALTVHGLQIHLAPLLRDNGLSATAAAGAAGLAERSFLSAASAWAICWINSSRTGRIDRVSRPLIAMALVGHATTVGLALAVRRFWA